MGTTTLVTFVRMRPLTFRATSMRVTTSLLLKGIFSRIPTDTRRGAFLDPEDLLGLRFCAETIGCDSGEICGGQQHENHGGREGESCSGRGRVRATVRGRGREPQQEGKGENRGGRGRVRIAVEGGGRESRWKEDDAAVAAGSTVKTDCETTCSLHGFET